MASIIALPVSVKLIMCDFNTGEEGIERIIDISNLYTSNNHLVPFGHEGNMLAPEEQHSNLLHRWITDRGNEQHDTILGLESFELIYA